MIFYNIRRRRRRENFLSKENLIKNFFCWLHPWENYPSFGQWGEASSILQGTVRACYQNRNLQKQRPITSFCTKFIIYLPKILCKNCWVLILSQLQKMQFFWSFLAKFLKDVDNKSQNFAVTFEFWRDSAKILEFSRFTMQFCTQKSQGWWLSNYRIDISISIRYWVYRYRYRFRYRY